MNAPPVNEVKTIEAYREALRPVLDRHADAIRGKIEAALAALPEKTRRFEIGIHPAQDYEGDFGIWIHLDGPDLYVLNKAIAPHRDLFSVRSRAGWTEGVPIFEPDDDQPFDVNDAIVDIVGDWLIELWVTIERPAGTPPASVFGEEGWGTKPVRDLP